MCHTSCDYGNLGQKLFLFSLLLLMPLPYVLRLLSLLSVILLCSIWRSLCFLLAFELNIILTVKYKNTVPADRKKASTGSCVSSPYGIAQTIVKKISGRLLLINNMQQTFKSVCVIKKV